MTITIVPPYAGPSWSNYKSINTFPAIWTAYRHKPLSGEIVMQMGVDNAPDFQIGIMQIGFQHTFTPAVYGSESIVVDINPGPITSRNISLSRVDAMLKGPGVDKLGTAAIQSYRPTSILLTATLQANKLYTLTFFGHIQINVDRGESAYGEIITAFPKVTRYTSATAAVAVGQPSVSAKGGEALMARYGSQSLEEAVAAWQRERPGADLRSVTLEEAAAAGADGFVG